MNKSEIIKKITLFGHLKSNELAELLKVSKIRNIKKGEKLYFKDLDSLCVISRGDFFTVSSGAKNQINFLPEGAIIGDMPFASIHRRGFAQPLNDSEILFFKTEDIYKILIKSYKALRCHAKIIKRTGLPLQRHIEEILNNKTKLIAVYSSIRNSGKSFLSVYLAYSLSKPGRTIILDVSNKGSSVYEILNITPPEPFSRKLSDTQAKSGIGDRIVNVDSNLDILNISYGGNMEVDPEIISPILFYLSQKYNYVIIDLSDFDNNLRDKVLGLSDVIFPVIIRDKDREPLYKFFDETLSDCQRVFYVANAHFAGEIKSLEGGFVLKKIESSGKDELLLKIKNSALESDPDPIVNLISKRKRGIVLESNLFESVVYARLLSSISKKNLRY